MEVWLSNPRGEHVRAFAVLGVPGMTLLSWRVSRPSMANNHLIEPVQNRVDGAVALPSQVSATLTLDAMHALDRRGIAYVIPSMPVNYPPVKAEAAVHIAATHFPVGSHPQVVEFAIIALKGF